MKKVIALTTALFLLIGASAFAVPPVGKKDPKDKKVKTDNVVKVKREPVITPRPSPTPAPAPAPAPTTGEHGKKKGWNKNPHNPHHPQSNNPGHAKK